MKITHRGVPVPAWRIWATLALIASGVAFLFYID